MRTLLFAVAVSALGCTAGSAKMERIIDGGVAICGDDAACKGGQCLASPFTGKQYCANSDGSCPSVLRWSTSAGEGLAGQCVDVASVDMSMPPDLALPDLLGSDLATFGCNGLINCINGCQDNTCRQACFDSATGNAQQLYNLLTTCLQTACPSLKNGDICFTITPACQQCYANAQQTGACVKESQTCSNDLP